MGHPVFMDTPVSRCAYYRRTCGLPAGIHPETGRIMLKAGVVGGVTMPALLGQRVRDDLLFRGCALGPVIAHIRSRRWTFLCRPDLPDDIRLFTELFRLDVSIVPFGAEIALPSPNDSLSPCRAWVVPPRDTFRPSAAVIIASVRSCTARETRSMTDVLPTRSQVLQACRGDTTPDHPLLRAARTLTVLHERRFATIPYPDEHCAPGMHVFERRRATPRASPFDTGEHHVRDAGVTARGLVVHRDPTADIDADRTRHIRAIDRWDSCPPPTCPRWRLSTLRDARHRLRPPGPTHGPRLRGPGRRRRLGPLVRLGALGRISGRL